MLAVRVLLLRRERLASLQLTLPPRDRREVERRGGGPSLLDRGYRYVNLDDGIMEQGRGADGRLVPDKQRFPSGMAFLAQQAHRRGLLLGLYTCVGTETCKGGRPGSYGHYEQDARTLAGWGVDMGARRNGLNLARP